MSSMAYRPQSYMTWDPQWDWTDAWPDQDTTYTYGDPKTGGFSSRATPEGGFYGDGTIWGEQDKGTIGDAEWSWSDRYGAVENRAGLYETEDGETQVGHHHQYSARKVEAEGQYGGHSVKFEGNGPSVALDANVGEAGLSVGAQASLADGAVTHHNIGEGSQDGLQRFGLSEGVGAAGRLHWGDKDGDEYAEYGLGADLGPVSFDLKSEDPVHDLLNSATAGFADTAADALGIDGRDDRGNVNWTHAIADGAGHAVDDAVAWAEDLDPSVLGGPLIAPLGGLTDLLPSWD